MERLGWRFMRDRLIAVAAFALAFKHLYGAGRYAWDTTQQLGIGRGPWAVSAYVLGTICLLGKCFGFSLVGMAFVRQGGLRAHRLGAGAWWIAGAYLLEFTVVFMGYAYADYPESFALGWRMHLIVVTTALWYLMGAATAALVALAYGTGDRGVSGEVPIRERLLGWSGVCLGTHAGFALLTSALLGVFYEMHTFRVLGIVAWTMVLFAGVAASFAFFGYRGSTERVREPRYATLLLASAAALAIFTVVRLSSNLVDNLDYLPAYWDSWLSLLASMAEMTAGVCLLFAFLVVYRATPRPVKALRSSDDAGTALPECPECGAPYDPAEYREDAGAWLCVSCGAKLGLA